MATPVSQGFALFLDGNERRIAVVPLDAKRFTWHVVDKMNAEMAEDVRSLLKKRKASSAAIKYVVVCQGSGSFSDSRSVTLIANLYQHVQSTPVYETESFDAWKDWLATPEKLKQVTTDLRPAYYAEPNITQAK